MAANEREILQNSKVIAVVGHSDKPHRTSYQIAQTMRGLGYTVYPVNPTVSSIDGEKSYASLAEIPEPIDIVNVFRRSQHLRGVVEEAIVVNAGAVWAQLGVADDGAARIAEEAGIPIVMDTCIKVAYFQLM
jgi:predicted CoA-binding protein